MSLCRFELRSSTELQQKVACDHHAVVARKVDAAENCAAARRIAVLNQQIWRSWFDAGTQP